MRRILPLLAIPSVAAQNQTAEPVTIPLSLILSVVAVVILIGVFVYLARR